MLYGPFSVFGETLHMDVLATAKAYNQKSVQQGWHQFCDPTLSFSDPIYREMLAVWRAKAGERSMPSRSELSARDLKNFLRHLVVVERNAHDSLKYSWRLTGTSLTEILGSHSGKSFEETVAPEHLPRWIESLNMILDSKQPWRFLGRVHLQGREYLHAEHLYVPLANDNEVPSFIMGFCRYTPRMSEDDSAWENELASIPGGLL